MGQVLLMHLFLIIYELLRIILYYLDSLLIPFLEKGGCANLLHVFEQTLHPLDAQDKNAEDHESHYYL